MVFKITDYADELLEGHEELRGGWPEKVLTMQKLIGKSFGTEVVFQVVENNMELPVFTTRVDTIYGVTYAVVAPEHPIVDEILKVNPSIKSAVMAMKNMDVIERTAEGKEKMELTPLGMSEIHTIKRKSLYGLETMC